MNWMNSINMKKISNNITVLYIMPQNTLKHIHIIFGSICFSLDLLVSINFSIKRKKPVMMSLCVDKQARLERLLNKK